MNLHLRSPQQSDVKAFLSAVEQSKTLHYPWLSPPNNEKAFYEYISKFNGANASAYLLLNESDALLGVFNVSEIVRGCFQSAYLGYYAFADFAGRGLMSQGLKLVLNKVFTNLKLHRIEANIQPENSLSINLVKANGFVLEGFSKNYLQINGAWRDHERWAITYEKWLDKGIA